MKTLILIIAFLSGFLFQIKEGTSLYGEQNNVHPRLILTSENIGEFGEKAKESNQQLFRLAEQQAEEFCKRPIIAFENAHNQYREIGDAMPVLGLMYQLGNNKKYVETAEKWISSMLNTKSWNGSQNLGRSSWIVGLCFLYDWMYDDLDKSLKKELIIRLVYEAGIVVETASSTRALSNHLLIETTAVGMVGLLLPATHPQKQIFLKQADNWAKYIIKHAPLDGSWGEGIQYWQYGTGYFLRFLQAAKTTGFKNYFDTYNWLKKNCYFPIYFSLPGNLSKVINFSDCGTDRYLPAFLFYLPASVYQNRHFQDFGEKVQAKEPHKFSWLDFLFYESNVETENFTSLPTFKHFDDHGFVSMRSGWEYGSTVVGFRCGPAPGHHNQNHQNRINNKGFGPGHQQPDINSFVVFAQNEWLIIDPGYTHLKETQNHNTILVNGFGQAGAGGKWLDYMEFESRNPVPEIVFSESNPVYDYVIGDAGNIYVDEAGLEYFRRHVIFLKPDVVVIFDELKANKTSTFEWNLQLNEITHVKQLNNQFKLTKNEVECWISPVLPANSVTLLKERLLEAGDVHGLPEQNSGKLKTLCLQNQAKQTNFLVVVNIARNSNISKPEIRFENNVLSVIHGSTTKNLIYNGDNLLTNKPLFSVVNK